VAEQTGIEWTDATWSPVTGCKAVSPGCLNCFAARLAATRLRQQPAYAGLAHLNESGRAVWSGESRCHPDRLSQPLKWKKGRRIFVCDMSDLFAEDVPDAFIDQVFGVMGACEDAGRGHTFQVLTKRAGRMAGLHAHPRPQGVEQPPPGHRSLPAA
jgi:protein gp37